MQIKRWIAGGLTTIAAGATLMAGALGAGLGDYVPSTDGSVTPPVIVVGDAVDSTDTIAAADVAAAVAGYATTAGTCATTAAVGVSGGIDLATTSTKIYLGSPVNRAKSTLTSTDLPTILASGTADVEATGSYKFDQYLTLGTSEIVFGNSGGDLTDPDLYIDIGTSSASPVYNLTLIFNKIINLSASTIQSGTLNLFGGEYTIGANSRSSATAANNKLELLGGAGATKVEAGASATVTISGVDHDVTVDGVESTTTATITVDGVSRDITEGNVYTFKGSKGDIDVYIKTVFFDSSGSQTNYVRVILGGGKIILQDGQKVKIGADETDVDGTLVFITADNSGTSSIVISVAGKDSSTDYILKGESNAMADPVFGSFKTALHGLNPQLDSTSRDSIVVDNSGTTGATVKFSDYRGNEATLQFAYMSSTTAAPELNISASRKYVVVENATVSENDYFLFSPSAYSDFSHMYELDVTSLGSSTGYFTLTDKMSGDSKQVYFAASAYRNKAFYIDGQNVYAANVSIPTAPNLRFTWGSNAAIENTGSKITVFPTIRAKGGEYVTLLAKQTFVVPATSAYNLTASAANVTLELPTGDLNITYYDVSGEPKGRIYLNGNNVTAAGEGTKYVHVTVGTFAYNLTVVWANYTTVSAIEPALSTRSSTNNPYGVGVLVVEELDNTTSTRGSVYVPVSKDSSSYMTVSAPILNVTDYDSQALQSDASVTKYITKPYGTLIEYDSDSQGIVTLKYPNDQAVATIAVGSNPVFTTTGVGGTYDQVVKITTPVAKFASEVTSAVKSAYNLILIGGPCANSVVATLMSTDNVTCANWAYTKGIIKEYANAFTTGKKALVIAGTSAANTRALAAKVMTGTMSCQDATCGI